MTTATKSAALFGVLAMFAMAGGVRADDTKKINKETVRSSKKINKFADRSSVQTNKHTNNLSKNVNHETNRSSKHTNKGVNHASKQVNYFFAGKDGKGKKPADKK